MKEIKKEIQNLKFSGKDDYQIIDILIERGFGKNEIITEFDEDYKERKTRWYVFGVLMILLAVLIIFNTGRTSGWFNYSFKSSKDFYKLNELVFKPYLSLNLIFCGINTIINKSLINRKLKLIMIISFSLFVLTSLLSSSPLSLLLGILGILIFSFYKIPQISNSSIAESLYKNVELGVNRYESLKKIKTLISNIDTKWKGSPIFVFTLLTFCLFLNSTIRLNDDAEHFHQIKYETIDIVLINSFKLLILLTFVTSILININFKKFKIVYYILLFITTFHLIVSLFHENFQISIYPCILLISVSSIKLFKNLKKQKMLLT